MSTPACARAFRVAVACAGAAARVCAVSSSSVVSAVAHAHATTLHGAHNSGSTGGLLSVQRSTSYCLDNSRSDTVRVQGPTGAKKVKVGVSSPAEDFLPVSEVEAKVNFRRVGGVRRQVAGSLPGRQPGTAVTPSLTRRFLTPDSRHLDVGWTSGDKWAGRRCVTPHDRGFRC